MEYSKTYNTTQFNTIQSNTKQYKNSTELYNYKYQTRNYYEVDRHALMTMHVYA